MLCAPLGPIDPGAYMGGRGGDAGEGAGGREGSARELGLQDKAEEEAEVVAIDVRFRG